MARQLLKSRRFILDTNHIDAGHQSAPHSSANAVKARGKSKTMIRNFT